MRLLPLLLVLAACPDPKADGEDTSGVVDTGWTECMDGCCDGDGDGYCSSDGDCDDNDRSINPDEPELCDGIDNNCNGEIDERVTGTYYVDADEDGFGDPDTVLEACEQPDGTTLVGTDCDDTDAAVFPSNPEICDDLDNNCDGTVDEGVATVRYIDADGDGFGDPVMPVETCEPLAGTVADATDCIDTDASVYPGAPETCDGVDDDCDGEVDEDATDAPTWYLDYDGDGYGGDRVTDTDCEAPAGYVASNDDCDDTSTDVSPGAAEVCDGVDQDCSGAIDDGGVCPCDVVEDAGRAYQLCVDEVNWYDAGTACEADGYTLATIGDATEDAFLRAAVAGYGAEYHWWFGYSDLASEGTWVWEDGASSSYTNWNTDEPNDLFGEDCGTFAYAGEYWNDWMCTNVTSYICEGP